MSNKVKRDNLIVGKKYKIFIEDCCVEATMIAVFMGYIDKEYGELLFDNAEFTNSSAVKFEEIK